MPCAVPNFNTAAVNPTAILAWLERRRVLLAKYDGLNASIQKALLARHDAERANDAAEAERQRGLEDLLGRMIAGVVEEMKGL